MKKRYTAQLHESIKNMDNIGGNPSQPIEQLGGMLEQSSFAVKVTRLTAALAQSLPFAIFARQYLSVGYKGFIEIPSGLTLTVRSGIFQNAGENPANYCKTQFIYTDGVDTDIIEVETSAASPYPALLEATISDVFKLSKMRISLSDATAVTQFSTDLRVAQKSIFGKAASNEIDQASYKDPAQFQNGIIDIPIQAGIDKETGILGQIIDEVAFTVTFSLFVSRTRRFNKNLLG